MRTVDRIFGWLMVVGAAAHILVQTALTVHVPPLAILRNVDAAFAQLLLGAVNLVRAERRHDLVLARICVAGNLFWLVLTVFAAVILPHMAMVPLLLQSVVALVLLLLSMRSRKRSRPM